MGFAWVRFGSDYPGGAAWVLVSTGQASLQCSLVSATRQADHPAVGLAPVTLAPRDVQALPARGRNSAGSRRSMVWRSRAVERFEAPVQAEKVMR